jgi:hypothetical protein
VHSKTGAWIQIPLDSWPSVFMLSCVVLAMGRSRVEIVLPLCRGPRKLNIGQGPKWAIDPIIINDKSSRE